MEYLTESGKAEEEKDHCKKDTSGTGRAESMRKRIRATLP